MDWKCCEFPHLSTFELYAILRVRSSVFVVESSHVRLDVDGRDEHAWHLFAVEPGRDSCDVAAYARVLLGDSDGDDNSEIVIDKILTGVHRRDDDTRNALIAHALTMARARWPERAVRISTSLDQKTFYESFGFRKTVGPFFEHGTPCIGMIRRETAAVPPGRTHNAELAHVVV
jgi:ElaA protein